MSDSDELLAELTERLRNRFYGKYRGTVTDVDSDSLRIKAKVPSVLHDSATGWCLPCVPYAGDQVGMVFLPEVGDLVWIEFEGGDPSYPIWAGCCWRTGKQPSDAAPHVRVIVTGAKHRLLFDDDAETITLRDENENELSFDSSAATISRGGQSLQVSDSSVSVDDGAWEVQG